jgi:cell wall assembly regulator SMI1
MNYVITEGSLNAPADSHVIKRLAAELGANLPDDYIAFLTSHNGGEGIVGPNYVVFWKAEELAVRNREYEVEKYAPGIVLFASDGAGEGIGFDTAAAAVPILLIPLIGIDRRDSTVIAANFSDLFTKLANRNLFDLP